jgi:hypothetical protein
MRIGGNIAACYYGKSGRNEREAASSDRCCAFLEPPTFLGLVGSCQYERVFSIASIHSLFTTLWVFWNVFSKDFTRGKGRRPPLIHCRIYRRDGVYEYDHQQ